MIQHIRAWFQALVDHKTQHTILGRQVRILTSPRNSEVGVIVDVGTIGEQIAYIVRIGNEITTWPYLPEEVEINE